jgi:DNA-binding CsgD family transcriptional regulator
MTQPIRRNTPTGTGTARRANPQALVTLIESAYAVDRSYPAWALGLLESVQAVIGCDLGGFMCFWEAPGRRKLVMGVDSVVVSGIGQKHAPRILDELVRTPWLTPIVESIPALGRCVLTSEVDPEGKLSYRSQSRNDGVYDGVNLIARDLDDRGFLISLGMRGGQELGDGLRRGLTRAVTHVLAGLRLRLRLSSSEPSGASSPDSPDQPEAILSPAGRVLHARADAKEASARVALATAVRAIERARAGLCESREEALDGWKGLVAARWTLVDSFEQDGKRYVVARENRPRGGGIDGLTPTESNVVAYAARGMTTKEIAYSLGISASTVRVLLMRASRRCGVGRRSDLLDLWARETAEAEDDRVVTPVRGQGGD